MATSSTGTLTNTSQRTIIIGPGPRSKRAGGKSAAAIVLAPADAKAVSDGSGGRKPNEAKVEGDEHARLKGCLPLQRLAQAGRGLVVK